MSKVLLEEPSSLPILPWDSFSLLVATLWTPPTTWTKAQATFPWTISLTSICLAFLKADSTLRICHQFLGWIFLRRQAISQACLQQIHLCPFHKHHQHPPLNLRVGLPSVKINWRILTQQLLLQLLSSHRIWQVALGMSPWHLIKLQKPRSTASGLAVPLTTMIFRPLFLTFKKVLLCCKLDRIPTNHGSVWNIVYCKIMYSLLCWLVFCLK